MNRQFNDNPSPEQQLATITTHLTYLLQDMKGVKEEVAKLALLQKEQNGNVSRVKEWQARHDNWHGPNDANIKERVDAIEEALRKDAIEKAREDGERHGEERVKVSLAMRDKFWFGVFVSLVGALVTLVVKFI